MSKFDDITIATTTELTAAGIYHRDLHKAVEAGLVVQAARGVFVSPEVAMDPRLQDVLACRRGGVIGYLTAAARHGLCDAVPDLIDVIVDASASRPHREQPIRYIRTRNPLALTLGVEVEDFHGWPIRMTEPARTVVDLYRIQPDVVRQHSTTAISRYFAEGHKRSHLHRIARDLGVWDVIRPEAEIAQETLRQGFAP